MFDIVGTILPVFLIIAAGYLAARLGVVEAEAAQLANRIVVWIPLPCLMFHIVASTDWGTTWNTGFASVLMISSLGVFLIGIVIARVRGLGVPDMAIDGLAAAYSNGAFIGLPLLALALGPATRPYVIVAATLPLCTLLATGTVLIELHASHGHGVVTAIQRALRATLANPVVASPLLGLGWWMTGWPLPRIAETFLTLCGSAASPLALISIGLFLAQHPITNAFSSRPAIILAATKLIVHPVLAAILVYTVIPLSSGIARIAILVSALPTGTGPFIINGIYGRDNRVASSTILLSTLLSILTISALLGILPTE